MGLVASRSRLKGSIAIAASLVVLAGAAILEAEEDPNAYDAWTEFIPSEDGTPLYTRVFRPRGFGDGDPTPVILTVTPYGGSGGAFFSSTPDRLFNQNAPGPGSLATEGRIFERGYSWVVVNLRGYGGSGGCYDHGGPGEQMDAKAAVEWAASRSWSTGKVGMSGHSYPGATQIMALAMKPKGLAAVVPSGAWTAYENFYMNRVRNTGGGTGLGAFYAASDLYPPGVFQPIEEWMNALGGTASDPTCYARVTANTYDEDPDSEFWREHDFLSRARGSDVPAMWVQGFHDWNVRPTAILDVYATLTGPRRAFFGPWDHGIARNGDLFVEEVMRFYDRHLKGLEGPEGPAVQVQSVDGSWRAEEEWPPADATPHPLPLRPASHPDVPGNNGETGLPAQFPFQSPRPLPTGTGAWTFTRPLPYDLHFAGEPRVTIAVETLAPDVHVMAMLYDVDEEGAARFISRGAVRVPESGEYAFELYPHDWRFPAGHRIGLLLSGGDDVWFEPSATLAPVDVTGGSLELPFLAISREEALPEGPFEARSGHAPFTIDPETIEAGTIEAELPPPMS